MSNALENTEKKEKEINESLATNSNVDYEGDIHLQYLLHNLR